MFDEIRVLYTYLIKKHLFSFAELLIHVLLSITIGVKLMNYGPQHEDGVGVCKGMHRHLTVKTFYFMRPVKAL